jgi:hypothetical protein
MPATARRRFVNIVSCLHGTLEINTIQSISFTEDTRQIRASGDNDRSDSFLARGKTSVSGEITLQDPIQAQALKAAAKADLKYSGEPESGGVAVQVTLKNVIFFTRRETDNHDNVWGVSLSFACYMPDGSDPVAIALAV